MAREVREYAVTIPTGTTAAAPHKAALAMPQRVITKITVRVPPGPRGVMGFAIASAGVPVIPINTGGWIVTDNATLPYQLTDYIDSGTWQVLGYNTGTYTHTIYLTFTCTLPGTPIAGGTSPAAVVAVGAAIGTVAAAGTPAPPAVTAPPPVTIPTPPPVTAPAAGAVPTPPTITAPATTPATATSTGGTTVGRASDTHVVTTDFSEYAVFTTGASGEQVRVTTSPGPDYTPAVIVREHGGTAAGATFTVTGATGGETTYVKHADGSYGVTSPNGQYSTITPSKA